MRSSWKQIDTFPIIVRIIEQAYREQPRFVKTREIIEGLMKDVEGRRLIEIAQNHQKERSAE